ncbi:MAG: hypothetical protein NT057_06120 [Actinobacteria bacterium]|nr:hypothetical protein [Actinomycetota bacterium]
MRKIAFVTTLILVAIQPISVAHAVQKKAPCRLEVDSAHLSTDIFEKFRFQAVKVNASSICNVPQSNVTITVEIWKNGLLGNHLVRQKTITSKGVTQSGGQVNNFSTYMKCRDRSPTHYYGVSYSKALINEKWQYARHILSNKTTLLNCGN